MKQKTRSMLMLIGGLAASSALCGCVVMGYSSRGGFFIWPGSIGLLLLLGLLWLIFSRR
jgi:hypothetical protein